MIDVNWNISDVLSVFAIIISGLTILWSIVNQRNQDKKWDQLNAANPIIKEFNFVRFKEITGQEANSTNWGYINPLIYTLGESSGKYFLPYYLAILHSETKEKIKDSNLVFTIEDVEKEMSRLDKSMPIIVSKCFKVKIHIENIGRITLNDLTVLIHMRLPNQDWEQAFQSNSNIRLGEGQSTTIFFEFMIDLNHTPTQFDFKVTKTWHKNDNDKESYSTGVKWTVADGFFSYLDI